MVSKRYQNQALNFLRGIGCIGVVLIHIKFPGITGEVVSKISQFAVPVFFMIAGYYSLGSSTDVIKKRLIKILKILIYGYLLFFIYHIAAQIKNGTLTQWLRMNFTLKTPIRYLVFCTIDFAIPLWYLIAMAETYFLWYFVVKHHKEERMLPWTPILFVFQIIQITICETNRYALAWHINFVTRALPWFLFGYYVHFKENSSVKRAKGVVISLGNNDRGIPLSNRLLWKDAVLAAAAAGGCIIAVIPVVFETIINFSCAGLLLYSLSLFLLAVRHPACSPFGIMEYIGEKLSLNIYILHVLISNVISVGLHMVFHVNTNSGAFLWIRPPLAVVSAIAFSWMIQVAFAKNAALTGKP